MTVIMEAAPYHVVWPGRGSGAIGELSFYQFDRPELVLAERHRIDLGSGGLISLPEPITSPETRDRYSISSLISDEGSHSNAEGDPLSPELVLQIHARVTNATLEDPSSAGLFRKPAEQIVIDDDYGDVFFTNRPTRMGRLDASRRCEQTSGKNSCFRLRATSRHD
jgi:hypothetical protein